MNIEKKIIHVSVPHRISGFFEIVDKRNKKKIVEPKNIGSRGAGFNLSALGKTTIEVEIKPKDARNEYHISINGEVFDERAETTLYICKYLEKYFPQKLNINIMHDFELPVGCGYGASGSGALGTVFGLNKILDLDLSNGQCSKIAHIAEVVNKTGLGTVCGQLTGGLCILEEPGYPCASKRIHVKEGFKVICGTFGEIHTKSILSDPKLSKRIKKAGQHSMLILNQDLSLRSFMKASIEFVEKTQILKILKLGKVKQLIEDLNDLDILGASMNQLGRSVYCIFEKEEKNNVIDLFEAYKPEIKWYDLKLNQDDPVIIH